MFPQVMDKRTQALSRMFAGMQVGNAVPGQMYNAPDNSWRKDVPAWFVPALTGGAAFTAVHLPHAASTRPGAWRTRAATMLLQHLK